MNTLRPRDNVAISPATGAPSKHLDQRGRLKLIQIVVVLVCGLILVSEPVVPNTSLAHAAIEGIGFTFVLACVAGRLWSILYIGGRKNDELIDIGPFSMTRNPLYLFSTLGAVGVGLMFGSFVVALTLGIGAYLIFRSTGNREARHLRSLFGTAYEAYELSTPRFWPNPYLYKDRPQWLFTPSALQKTFRDGFFFLAIFPAVELLELLQGSGVMPVVFRIY